jgi:hypothetical protein
MLEDRVATLKAVDETVFELAQSLESDVKANRRSREEALGYLKDVS